MIQLPNRCSCSELKVIPSNWQSAKASVKKKWYIYYRFYDPCHKSNFRKESCVLSRGMNEASTLEEKQKLVRALIGLVLGELKNLGFNPILENHLVSQNEQHVISPSTPFVRALRLAFEKARLSVWIRIKNLRTSRFVKSHVYPKSFKQGVFFFFLGQV